MYLVVCQSGSGGKRRIVFFCGLVQFQSLAGLGSQEWVFSTIIPIAHWEVKFNTSTFALIYLLSLHNIQLSHQLNFCLSPVFLHLWPLAFDSPSINMLIANAIITAEKLLRTWLSIWSLGPPQILSICLLKKLINLKSTTFHYVSYAVALLLQLDREFILSHHAVY